MSSLLKITLVRSLSGRPQKQRRVVEGLGLRKLNRSVFRENTDSIMGMVNKVCHLVKVEEVTDDSENLKNN